MKRIIILIILMPFLVTAQNVSKKTLRISTKKTENGVLLKFAPSKADIWLKGAMYGYNIERIDLSKSDKFEKLNINPIQPFRDADFKSKNISDSLRLFQNEFLWNNIDLDLKDKSVSEQFNTMLQMDDLFGYYMLMTTRFRDASRISGMEYLDETVKKNVDYIYKVSLLNKKGEVDCSVEKWVYASSQKTMPPNITVQPLDKKVKISWPHSLDETPILCYEVEKSLDSIDFKKITKNPLYFNNDLHKTDSTLVLNSKDSLTFKQQNFLFEDKLAENLVPVYYRIRGIDVWGEYTPYSMVYKTNGIDLTPPTKPLVFDAKPNIEVNDEIIIKWSYKNKPNDFVGYIILNAHSLKGNYLPLNKQILNINTDQYIHKKVKQSEGQYYKIAVLDKYGNINYSDPFYTIIPDTKSPGKPSGLKGEILKNGLVNLTWSHNSDEDLKGYLVFGANDENIHFSKLSQLPTKINTFVDTLNLKRLDHFKYYKIVAVDNSFNASPESEVIKLVIPDIMAPPSGKIDSIYAFNSKIYIPWTPSKVDDLSKHFLYQKAINDTIWNIVDEKNYPDSSDFVIEGLKAGKYIYALASIDLSGNKSSFGQNKYFEVIQEKFPLKIQDINLISLKGSVQIEVEVSDKTFNYFMIYKQVNDGDFLLINSLKNMTYIDKDISAGFTYSYYVIGQTKDGEWSPQSSIKKITYQ